MQSFPLLTDDQMTISKADELTAFCLLSMVPPFVGAGGRPGRRLAGTPPCDWLDGIREGDELLDVTYPVGEERFGPEFVSGGRGTLTVRAGDTAPDGVLVHRRTRSVIDERVEQVAELRQRFERVVMPMLRRGALREPDAWLRALADDLLADPTVDPLRETVAGLDEFATAKDLAEALSVVWSEDVTPRRLHGWRKREGVTIRTHQEGRAKLLAVSDVTIASQLLIAVT